MRTVYRVTITEDHVVPAKGEVLRQLDLLCRQVADRILDRARRLMELPKHGRFYSRRGRVHQASAPGEPPAVDTGALYESLRVEKAGDADYLVGTGDEKAVWLEFGTRRMAARPFLARAAREVEREL